MKYVIATVFATLAASVASAQDAPPNTLIELKNSAGAAIGAATLAEGPTGVLVRVEVKGLTPGWHGLHFHA